jgi:DNA-binding SARP family transcriptional activator
MGTASDGGRRESKIDLSLLNGFELRCDGVPVPITLTAQRLVAFVALRDRPVRREYVSGSLWTEASEHKASSSLRSALWRVPAPRASHVIEASNSHLWLAEGVRVDFRQILIRAQFFCNGDDKQLDADDVLSHAGGLEDDLLPDWYEEWVIIERERFRQLRLHALERLCERLTEAGRYSLALQAGLSAVSAEPLRESAHRQVINAHIKEGNLSEALRQYQFYTDLLASELGIQPSEKMSILMEEVCPRNRRAPKALFHSLLDAATKSSSQRRVASTTVSTSPATVTAS